MWKVELIYLCLTSIESNLSEWYEVKGTKLLIEFKTDSIYSYRGYEMMIECVLDQGSKNNIIPFLRKNGVTTTKVKPCHTLEPSIRV